MKCFNPMYVKLRHPIWSEYENSFISHVNVPCGKCHACLHRKIAEWSFRLENERIDSKCTYFVTLTYDNEHVPYSTKNGRMELNKKHLQDFFKRLRQLSKRDPNYGIYEDHYFNAKLKNEKISYFAAGEYGSKRKRPHYHLIIFNASRHAITQAWTFGDSDIQVPRSSAAVAYTAKYMYKKLFTSDTYGVQPEFHLMSKGLGDSYIRKMKGWHIKNNDVLFTTNESGMKVPMSRYIRNKIFTEQQQRQQIPIIKKNINENEAKERKKLGDQYDAIKETGRRAFSKKFEKSNKLRRREDI